MEQNNLNVEQRVKLLYEVLEASHGLTYWIYDADGNCLETNCKGIALDAILTQGSGKADMLEHGRASNHPLMLSLPLGLIWVAAFEHRESVLHRIYVLGPAFHTEISMRGIVNAIEKYQIPQGWKLGFMDLLQNLPVLSITSLRRVAVMLHCCITGERIPSIEVEAKQTDMDTNPTQTVDHADRHRTYMAEQKLLNNVRQGNLDYQSALIEAGSVSSGVRVKTDTSAAQVRMTQVVFISLCVRAAIEGGVTPDLAYSTGDAYIQLVNDTEDLGRLGNIGHMMYQNFIQMVHDCKKRSDLSKAIQSCCDFISLHLEDELTTQALSERIGYTVNYLAKRFTKEVGISPTEYIKQKRIERACQLLTTTTDSIPEISRRLHFCNRGYFSTVFKEQMGMTPVEYRQRNQVC